MPPLEPVYEINEEMTKDELYNVAVKLVNAMPKEQVYKYAYKHQAGLLYDSLRARKKRVSKHTKNKD